MRVSVFSTKPHDRRSLMAANQPGLHRLTFLEPRLSAETAPLAAGTEAVCAFVNDSVDAAVIAPLRDHGVKLLVLRSAGYNHDDLAVAEAAGSAVGRVPAYSPHAVAEFTIGLLLAVDRPGSAIAATRGSSRFNTCTPSPWPTEITGASPPSLSRLPAAAVTRTVARAYLSAPVRGGRGGARRRRGRGNGVG